MLHDSCNKQCSKDSLSHITVQKASWPGALSRTACQHCACLFHIHVFVVLSGLYTVPAGHTMSMLCSWTWPHSGQEAFWSVTCKTLPGDNGVPVLRRRPPEENLPMVLFTSQSPYTPGDASNTCYTNSIFKGCLHWPMSGNREGLILMPCNLSRW